MAAVTSVSQVKTQEEPDFLDDEIMDSDGKFHLLWASNEETIFFQIQVKVKSHFEVIHFQFAFLKARTKGYVAIGFSPEGQMAGSDVFLAWLDPDGRLNAHVRRTDYENVSLMTS